MFEGHLAGLADVAREAGDELGDGLAGLGHEVEEEGHGGVGVAAELDGGEDDAAGGAFAADGGFDGLHGFDDVRFADGCAVDLAAAGEGDVVDDHRGGEIHDDVAGHDGEGAEDGEGEDIVVVEDDAVFVDDGEAVGVGVLREADFGAGFADEFGEVAEGVGAGLGDAGEDLGGVDGDGVEAAVETVREEAGGHDGAGAVDGVEGDAELAAADAVDVDLGEDAVDVDGLGGAGVFGDVADFGVGGLGEVALVVEVDELVAFVVVEELALLVEELEGVVLGRVVGGGEADAAAGAEVFDVDLDGGGGEDSDVDDVAAGGEQATLNGVLEHGAGEARVAADDDAAAADVGAEGLGEVEHKGGREELRDDAADAGYADAEEVFAGH